MWLTLNVERENSEAADHRRVPPGGQSGRRGVLFEAAG